jgi:methanogenic corrinoid protein MtbC1
MKEHFLIACEHLGEHQVVLAKTMTELQLISYPELEKKFGKSGKAKCLEDNTFHIRYLIEAVRFQNSGLFKSYLHWAAGVLNARNIPIRDLENNLRFMESACLRLLPDSSFKVVSSIIRPGIEALKNIDPLPETYLVSSNPFQSQAREYLSLVLNADRQKARAVIYGLLKTGCSIKEIYQHIFQNTQYEIGLLWQTNRISVAHEHYCTAVTQAIIAGLYDEVFWTVKETKKMIGCAVSGELHEMGIRMLTDFFELEGWDTYYLGANMPDANLIMAACEQNADLLAISVTTPFNLGKAELLIRKIRSNSQLDKLKILVGGYAFNTTPHLWKQIGADGSAENARQAVEMAETLIKK